MAQLGVLGTSGDRLSFSGAYESDRWAVADVFFPAQGAAYLGSQGDIWDAQKDARLGVERCDAVHGADKRLAQDTSLGQSRFVKLAQ
ncbi:MAG: DUF2238 domain-containing protein [Flavobacteriales bacterium]